MEVLFRIKCCFCCHFLIARKGVRELDLNSCDIGQGGRRADSRPFSILSVSVNMLWREDDQFLVFFPCWPSGLCRNPDQCASVSSPKHLSHGDVLLRLRAVTLAEQLDLPLVGQGAESSATAGQWNLELPWSWGTLSQQQMWRFSSWDIPYVRVTGSVELSSCSCMKLRAWANSLLPALDKHFLFATSACLYTGICPWSFCP